MGNNVDIDLEVIPPKEPGRLDTSILVLVIVYGKKVHADVPAVGAT